MVRKNNVFFYRKAKPGDYINTVTLSCDEKKRHAVGLRPRLPTKKEWQFRRAEKNQIDDRSPTKNVVLGSKNSWPANEFLKFYS